MRGFEDILMMAVERKGSFDAVLGDLEAPKSADDLAATPDSADHGSFGRKVGDWPQDDYFGLLDWLKKEGARLGGNTGAYGLRMMGRDGFMMTRDVVARLVAEGVIAGPPTSKAAKAAVQAAFNAWHAETGYNFTQMSRVQAYSID